MFEDSGTSSSPSQNNEFDSSVGAYLARAVKACASGESELGLHLYLTAYEQGCKPDGRPSPDAAHALRKAWMLAVELKHRSLAEYIFEKLEPLLDANELSVCAEQLQRMALDKLQEFGLSREDLEDMTEMISQDYLGLGSPGRLMKIEHMTVPTGSLSSNPFVNHRSNASEAADEPGAGERAQDGAASVSKPEAVEAGATQDRSADGPVAQGEVAHAGAAEQRDADEPQGDDDLKGYAAENEAAGCAAVGTEALASAKTPAALETPVASAEPAVPEAPAASVEPAASEAPAASAEPSASEAPAASEGTDASTAPAAAEASSGALMDNADAHAVMSTLENISYRDLAGYGRAISVMRDFGIGMQNDPHFQSLVRMLNRRHGFDRMPAADSFVFRAAAREDAHRFMTATLGEIGLPAIRMHMEENLQGLPVLCVMAQADHHPKMNAARNAIEGAGVLLLEDLDLWVSPLMEAEEDYGVIMPGLSRAAREAINLIRSAVENPEVFVLASAADTGEIEGFFFDLLEPLTVVDIDYPDEAERGELWDEIARDHPSLRELDRDELVRFTAGMPRYDIYMAARESVEDAYKESLMRRRYVPVALDNLYEKLAAYQPLDSDEYRALEDAVVADFARGLDDDLDDLTQDKE